MENTNTDFSNVPDVFTGELPNYKPEFDNENDLKVAMFNDAIAKGEADHLHPDQSIKAIAERALWRLSNKIFEIGKESGSEDGKAQSIVTMAHTLFVDGRVNDLYEAIKNKFPEYFINDAA